MISERSTFTQLPKTPWGFCKDKKLASQPGAYATGKRKGSLPEGIKGVGCPDICAQHVQRVVFAAILEKTGDEKGGVIS